MLSRAIIRRLPNKVIKLSTKAAPLASIHTTTNKMSMFPRFQEITPLFRLLEDYDRASRTAFQAVPQSLRSFNPKFDVKETKEHYELHGELPGIEQKDINIEWTDGNTLTISGRTEHRSEKGTPPQGFIEEGKEGQDQQSHDYQKPTVEDEQSEGGKQDNKEGSTAVTKTGSQEVQKSEPEAKYWVTERAVGEFHRSFSFPTRVDQEKVKASLKDGILTIVVPKAQAPKPRKINIE
jgi:HSP20 family protein